MMRKEKKVANKLQEAEIQRKLQLELSKERQRLVHEENQRRIESQKRQMQYKKL